MLFRRLSKGLLGLGLAALALASGCNADYGLFKVHSSFDNKNYDNIYQCKLTITDQQGKDVEPGIILQGHVDTDTGKLTSGCSGGNQRATNDIGSLNYSTSRTSGTLTFTVDAYDNNNNKLQSGSASQSVKVFHGDSDLQPVEISVSQL